MKKIIAVIISLFTLFTVSACKPANVAQTEADKTAETAAETKQGTVTNAATKADTETAETTKPETNPETVTDAQTQAKTPEYTVRAAEWAAVEWEQYTSPYFTLTIPRGWHVQWQGDANQLRWMVTNDKSQVGMFNLDHAYAAKDPNMAAALGFGMSMTGGTVREFFENFFAQSTEYFTVKNSCVPDNKDILQSARPYTPIRDYQSLYATFKDANLEGEGVYTAVVMESQDVIYGGRNYGAWEVNCVFYNWAPVGELVNWSPVLSVIAKSFNYTEYYLREWQAIAQSAVTPSSSVNDPDPVMEAFEERSKSDTVIQEKRSDMIGEYERVMDNETGNIYRAYNGFLDDMGDQSRYTPITDSQYADGFVGWIDKD